MESLLADTRTKEADMKALAIAAIGTAMLVAAPAANAKGCIKGALVGGTAGHFVGHHGILGAAAGCLVGHHYANKHARMNRATSQSGYGSSAPPRSDYNSSVTPQQVPAQRY